MAAQTPHRLWRIWARTSRLKGLVQIIVAAPTAADACAIIGQGAVIRCRREVRS